MIVGQALNETENWANFGDPLIYTTSAAGEAIADVTALYTGDATNASEPFSDGDLNGFAISVTDSAGTTKVFDTTMRAVVHAAPQVVGLANVVSIKGGGPLQLDVSAGFTGAGDVIFDLRTVFENATTYSVTGPSVRIEPDGNGDVLHVFCNALVYVGDLGFHDDFLCHAARAWGDCACPVDRRCGMCAGCPNRPSNAIEGPGLETFAARLEPQVTDA